MILTSLLLCFLDRPFGAEEQRVGIPNFETAGPVRPFTLAGTCPFEVSAHTDADFGGGQYTVQAGFAEQEVAAASWTLDPAVFPIRLDVAEMVFATSNANVTTTTEWTFFVWSGTPASGNVVAQYSSDGELLPHIVLQPGTTGVNVQVLVDPDDPEQIIINDNGDATFSIGSALTDTTTRPATHAWWRLPPPKMPFQPPMLVAFKHQAKTGSLV